MIVSGSVQIAPKSAHDHETWSPPGTRAAGRMSGTGCYVRIEIALRDRVPQERPVTIPSEICDRAPGGYQISSKARSSTLFGGAPGLVR